MQRRLVLRSACLVGSLVGGGTLGAATSLSPAADRSGTWTRLADMPTGLAKFGVAALNGKIYVTGGYDTRRSLMVYDIATDRWSIGPDLPRGTDNVAALAANDKVYAIGGEASSAFQVFDPISGTWSAAPTLPRPVFASAAATWQGRLHLVGGWNYSNTASASVAHHSVFNTATNAWTRAAPLQEARNAAGAAAIDASLYVVGGRSPGIRANDQQSLASLEAYDATTDQWLSLAPMPTARGSLAVVALGGRLYALGGEATPGTVTDAVECFDPATRSWRVLTAMPYRSHGLGAVAMGTALYVMGGFTGAGDAVGRESVALYRYQP